MNCSAPVKYVRTQDRRIGQTDESFDEERYYADFEDSRHAQRCGTMISDPLRFSGLYEPVEIEGLLHCYSLRRAVELDQFLRDCGPYRISGFAFREACISGWDYNVTEVAFERDEDALRFAMVFGECEF